MLPHTARALVRRARARADPVRLLLPPPLTRSHWLDARFPRASAWLLTKARDLWLQGLRERASLHPHLLDPAFVVPAVASKADALAAAASPDWAPLDARGRAHLQTACLAAATGAVLAPFVRDDEATLAIVAESAGARADAPARALLAGATWATRMAGGDPVAAAGRRLTGLLADKGSAARGEVAVTPDAATLTVTACAAHAVCSSPDLDRGLRWLPALCCSAESGLFPGLACERRAWLGGGDGACVVRVGRGEGER